ncbi:hypothetical protein CTAYLR_008002 [Chrysophaeum taylorii]|uniref:Thioredoxin domain-containing protein n=1 Tax=Chrysophaeum taylorii TaxID=2483200 RepID=A0AAD7U9F2_9STRA|nr:hypothetical protein CTAYLR_008002 [Chrysophaeum taylorii]
MQLLLLLAYGAAASRRSHSIVEYGGIPDNSSTEVALRNGLAFAAGLLAAPAFSELVFPANAQWYMIPANESFSHLAPYVTVRIEGQVVASDAIEAWPSEYGGDYLPLFGASDTVGIAFEGSGSIAGQGHRWWWAFLLNQLGDAKRPVLIRLDNCVDVAVSGLVLLDAPRFNIYLGEFTRTARISRVTILVDWRAQLSMTTQTSLPMFPFNTDGIDVAGRDILVEDCVVSNWDDTIAVKPSKRTRLLDKIIRDVIDDDDDDDEGHHRGRDAEDEWLWSWCTRNVTVSNLTTVWGAGISVGSVHPSRDDACVKDVLFADVRMYSPLKGVYVKPDVAEDDCDRPGVSPCAALIANITYANISIDKASFPDGWLEFEKAARAKGLPSRRRRLLNPETARRDDTDDIADFSCGTYDFLCFLWPVYIGVQQQLEPTGQGSGIWPAPDPRTTVVNITLDNVTATGGYWPEAAGVIRCNASNPCRGLHFYNVDIQADHFGAERAWICDDGPTAFGTIKGLVSPNASRCVLPGPRRPPPRRKSICRRRDLAESYSRTMRSFILVVVLASGACGFQQQPVRPAPLKLHAMKELSSERAFDAAVKKAAKDKLVVVDFATTWCGPCKVMEPKVNKLSEEYTDTLFYKVTGDSSADASSLMKREGVRAVPSFHFWKNGERVEVVNGANIDAVTSSVEKYA